MARAVQRHALNALRGRTRRFDGHLDRVLWSGPSPDYQSEQVELRERLHAALRQLTPEQRQAVLLFDLAEWPHDRIAELLGTSPAMSRQHVMLGRRRLRRLLEAKDLTND